MDIREDIVSQGHGELSPSYLVIHETANPGATAQNHRDFWARDDTYAVHYVADWDEVIHCVPDNRLCWQVGNGNPYCIGIELCHATNADDFSRVWDNGVQWARMMLDQRGWGIDRLIPHKQAAEMWGGSDHTDPIGYFAEFGRTWDEFVQDVETGGTDVITDDDIARIADGVHRYRLYPDVDTGIVLRSVYGMATVTDDAGTGEEDVEGCDIRTNAAWNAKRTIELEQKVDALDAKLDKLLKAIGK